MRWLSGALYSEPTWIWPSVFLVEHETLPPVLLVYRERIERGWTEHRIVAAGGDPSYRDAAHELRVFAPDAWTDVTTRSLWTGLVSPTVPGAEGAYPLSATSFGVAMRGLVPPTLDGPWPEWRKLRQRYRPVLQAALGEDEIRAARRALR